MVMAIVYTRAGELDLACEEVDLIVSMPSQFSLDQMIRDPLLADLHDYPCFKTLLQEYQVGL